ncbi:hypothetical protein L1887_01421 [Cichorium endivia]|nr:hypothetical protein L1887_01421 [Cichorium endivia]
MAVAGMNNVTVLETSYLGENYPPVSRRWGNQERPITRTSYIRKMWRDLEGESRFREIERQQTSAMTHSNIGSQCSCPSERDESEDTSITTSEVENECPRDHNQMELHNRQEDNINSCVQRSPALCLADKQRVRQIFREWGSKNSHGHGHGHTVHKNNCSRVQGVCENECKRVRTVRQWIESNTREAESGGSIRRLYGRQALLDLLARFQMERNQEIQSLLVNRPVSTFSHRNRIQSLLRGRFLWNQRFIQEEKSSTSIAANELGLLRQTQTVSDLRKGFLSRLVKYEQIHDGPQYDTASEDSMDSHQENLDDTINQNGTINTVTDVGQPHRVDSETDTRETTNGESQDIINENETVNTISDVSQSHRIDSEIDEGTQQLALTEFVETRDENQQATVECQEPIVEDNGSEWHHVSDSESNNDLDLNSIENEDEWYQESNDGSYEHGENWYPEASEPVRRDVFYDSDEDNGNRPLELRELMSRRRVSNLLGSEFRVRLDQLLQTYVERQDQASESNDDEWMTETEEQNQDQDQDHEIVDGNVDVIEAVEGEQSSLQQNDWRMIDGLRVEMVNLQERMNSMQKTLETCMSMQLELQRTVRQEVSSALNRSEAERSCFLCCDGAFDTSPDRCGHVYVCSKCVGKVDWSKVKESVRHP